MKSDQLISDFEKTIRKSYKKTNRSNLWLVAALMQESGELAEHIIKHDGYNKLYKTYDLLSEAGDVLNFLTAILQAHGLSLENAMKHNTAKLKERGWVK